MKPHEAALRQFHPAMIGLVSQFIDSSLPEDILSFLRRCTERGQDSFEASVVRTVTQTFRAHEGTKLHSVVQREKLFKNAVWWLLKLARPPPFLNLSVAIDPKSGS